MLQSLAQIAHEQDQEKRQFASGPPVDAVQYEKLALSVFGLCERQLTQLNRLSTLATSIYRNPALTSHERWNEHVRLELLVEACEEYEREVECDRERHQMAALDARGIAALQRAPQRNYTRTRDISRRTLKLTSSLNWRGRVR